jgi:hypothetical protein
MDWPLSGRTGMGPHPDSIPDPEGSGPQTIRSHREGMDHMRGSLKRSAVATVGLLVLAWAVLPMAMASAASKNNVGNGDEAWFQAYQEPLAELPSGDPSCDSPAGCNVAGNVSRGAVKPHPEGVLVVAVNAGEADAQTFFNFDVDNLPLGAVVTGGKVTMPVATDPEAGNLNEESAKLVACLVTGFIPGGADGGSYQDRPEFDDGACVPVEQDDTAETLTYTFDLNRFGKAWGTGTTPMQGVTVMVDPEVSPPAPNETWRVAFNSQRRHNQAENPDDFPPITSDLQFTVKAGGLGGLGAGLPDDGGFDDTGDGGFEDSGAAGGGGDFGGGASGGFDSGSAPADTGAISAPQSADAPAVDAPAPAEGGEEQPLAAPAGGGEAVPAAAAGMSPAVWLMPLLALAMAGALAWSLLQPVELVGEREGAVSKLMRNRRLTGSDPSNLA